MKSTGCVLDWRGGTRDFSRYHHTLTEHNTIPVRGVNGEARDFNGVDAYLDCGNDASLNTINAITVEAWIKPNTLISEPVIVCKGAFAADGFYFQILNTGILRPYIILSSGGAGTIIGGSTVNTNEWNYISMIYGGSGILLYLNGLLTRTDATGGGTITTNTRNLYIAQYDIGVNRLNGTISSVKIYNRALTPLEIWNNYVTMKPYIPLSESPVAIL